MNDPRTTCVRCGSPIAASQPPERPCPRCLLALGLERGDDATGSVALPAGTGLDELAPLFPQLELLEVLGQGGMGVVYRARQRDLDREVALKVLRPPAEADAEDPAFAERFGREARALAQLTHPNIVAIHDFGRAGPHYYLLMELVDGANLRRVMDDGRLAPAEALGIVAQLSRALEFAHEHGVVHRDVKPENILIDRTGTVKIVDFGLAKMTQQDASGLRLTHTGQAMGTPQYMAPEQIERPLEVDHRADIYSLGVVLYELLTGELPLGRFASPSRKVEVDVRLDQVVLRTLEKEPERRYQAVSEVRTDLEHLQSAPPSQGTRLRRRRERRHASRSGGRKRRSWGWIVALCLLVTCVPLSCLGAALFLGATQAKPQPLSAPVEPQGSRAVEAPAAPAATAIETSDPDATEPEAANDE